MSADIKTGGPAFPSADFEQHEYTGMTLRDYFAAKAMQAFLSAEKTDFPEQAAAWAYQVADAMLEARK
jgi:hypothetical protein